MKIKLPLSITLLTMLAILNSCYKTGEIIYQPVCKTTEMIIDDLKYTEDLGVLAPAQHQSFTYSNDNNRRLIRADVKGSEVPMYFTFEYDGNNNLVRENFYANNALFRYYVLSYPTGTKNSASSEIYVAETPVGSITYNYTFKYNSELQLLSISNAGGLLYNYDYDFNGNCTKATRYGGSGQIVSVLEFTNYDNQTNPGRTDRFFQLFINNYSKSNCTQYIATRYTFNPSTGLTTETKDTLYSAYQYNHNLPFLRNGAFYAAYDCIPADPNAPGSK